MMNTITCPIQKVVEIYVGGANGNPPPAGPCNILYSVTQQGNVQNIAFMSETDWGALTSCFVVSDVVAEADWLTMGPAYPDPLDLQPIKVDALDLDSGAITCTAAKAQEIMGGLQTGIVLHAVTPQGNLSRLAFCSNADGKQGKVKTKFVISDVVSETSWANTSPGSGKVDGLQFTIMA